MSDHEHIWLDGVCVNCGQPPAPDPAPEPEAEASEPTATSSEESAA